MTGCVHVAMMTACVLHYGWFVLASLIGSGLGSFIVVRFWKTGELNGNGRDLKQK